MTTWITAVINQMGGIAVLFLIALENVFPPIPSEVILTLAGFMTHHSQMTVLEVIIMATIGAYLGAVILYFIGRQLTKERLEHLLTTKLFKLLGFKKTDVQKAIDWFEIHGIKALLYGRCIPVVRSLISIPAGIAQVKFSQFSLLTIIGSLIWNIILVNAGALMGEHWQKVAQFFDTYSTITLMVLVIGGIIFCVWWYQKRIKQQKRS